MKYITTLLLIFIALSLSAQQDPLTVHLSHNLDDNSGGVFDVELRVSDFVELYSFQLFLKWNPDLYRIDGVPYVNNELPSFDEDGVILPAEDLAIPDDGKLRIVWANATTSTLAEDTHLVTFRFTTLGQPCEEAKFFFEDIGDNENEELLAVGSNLQDIGISFDDMNVQIPGVGCTSSNGNLRHGISAGVYPNPVRDVLNVELSNSIMKDTYLSFYSQEGKVIKKVELGQAKSTISLADLKNGSYLYSIKQADQNIANGKLLKIE